MSEMVTVPVELRDIHQPWFEEMAKKYVIEDMSKVIRNLIEYAKHERDQDEIFGDIRCKHC
jgi:hypothetical protein